MKNTAFRVTALLLVLLTLFLTACSTGKTLGTEKPESGSPTLETPSTAEPIDPTKEPSTPPTVTPSLKMEEDPALAVSELMAQNSVTVADAEGNYRPWIELMNISDAPVSLSGYSLTVNDSAIPLPDKQLASGEYLVVFAQIPTAGQLLLMHGEECSARFSYSNPTPERSFLVKGFTETETPTPGAENVFKGGMISVSELLSVNTIAPINGKLTGYIELYNPGLESLALQNFYFTTDLDDPFRYRFPEKVLDAGGYLAITAEELGAVFSAFASTLYIFRADGILCGSASYPDLLKNAPYTPEGYALPTPGYQNNDTGRTAYLGARGGLIISEVISSNTEIYKVNGDYYDLVELYNAGTEPLSLSDYYLSDSSKDLFKYNIPAGTLEPGAFTVAVLTGEGGEKGSSFKLSSDGDDLYVTSKDQYITDAVVLPYIPVNRSWGRSNGEFVYFATPTFGKLNGLGHKELSPKPIASVPSGFYKEPQNVTFSYEGTVYYTTDFSKPTTSSKVYNGETLTLTGNTSVRMICYYDDRIPSDEICYNYFIDDYDLELPVIKVTVNHEEMYGENGIYTLNYYDGEYHYNRDEIESSVAYYIGGEEQFSFNCGVKIFGSTSRIYKKKSYHLKFRAVYGTSKLKYDIFEDGKITEFNSIVLRSGSQDISGAMMRDEVATDIVESFSDEILTQNYRPVNLYINDEYIGVYFFKEKINADFVASKLNVSPESVAIVEAMNKTEVGDCSDWHDLYKYIKNNDMSKEEHYKYVSERLSIDSVIDYYVAQTFLDNRDYGNVRIYRTTENDGLWRFILYDCDQILGTTSSNKIDYYSRKVSMVWALFDNTRVVSLVIRRLMKNEEFKDRYYARLNAAVKNEFSSERTVAIAETIRDAIKHDMKYSKHTSYSTWSTSKKYGVPMLINYLSTRDTGIIEEYVEYFKMTAEEIERYFPKDDADAGQNDENGGG